MSIPTTGSTNGYEAGQVATSTTAAIVVPARAQRYRCTIVNTDTSITVYIGHNASTGPTTGIPLIAGASKSFYTSAALWAESASGTPTLAYDEEFQN